MLMEKRQEELWQEEQRFVHSTSALQTTLQERQHDELHLMMFQKAHHLQNIVGEIKNRNYSCVDKMSISVIQ